MQGVTHYLVDVLQPEDEFHIVKFQEMAKAAMKEIYAKGKIPILVGGTGFYIQAVTSVILILPRQKQDNLLSGGAGRPRQRKGAEYLHEKLQGSGSQELHRIFMPTM